MNVYEKHRKIKRKKKEDKVSLRLNTISHPGEGQDSNYSPKVIVEKSELSG